MTVYPEVQGQGEAHSRELPGHEVADPVLDLGLLRLPCGDHSSSWGKND